MSVGFEMTRTLVYRHRFGLVAMVAYLAGFSGYLLGIGTDRLPTLTAILFLGLFVGGVYLVAVFIHPDSDVASPGSTYPPHYFTLPVKTRDLVLWPVGAGIVCLGAWMLVIGVVMRKAGINYDPIAGALFVIALLTSMQAIFWTPLGIPYSKLVLTLIVIAGIWVISVGHPLFGFAEGERLVLFGAVILVSIVLTWIGVASARAGDIYRQVTRSEDKPTERTRPVRVLPAFRSAKAAQLWYEWRMQGKTLPILSLLLYVAFLIPLFWNDTLSPIYDLAGITRDITTPEIPTYLKTFLPALLFLMPVYGWAIGCGARKSDVRRSDRAFHLFFATRPTSDAELVWTKLRVAALSTLAAWGFLLIALLPLVFMEGGNSKPAFGIVAKAPMYAILAPYLQGWVVVKVLAVLFVAIFFTWRNFIIGFWTELSGSLFLRYAQPAVASILLVSAFTIGIRFQGMTILQSLPIVLGLMVAAKFALASIVAYRQGQSGLLSSSVLLRVGIGYILGVSLMGYAVYILLGQAIQMGDLNTSGSFYLQTFTLLTLLCVPLARVLLAVSALSRNRHR